MTGNCFSQQRMPAFAHRGNFGARKVDLPIRSHQHLDGFDLGVVGAQTAPTMHKFVA